MMTRRSLIGAATLFALLWSSAVHAESDEMRLWSSQPPGGGGPTGQMVETSFGARSNIDVPTIRVYAPKKPNGVAALVAAGGGYRQISLGGEARPAAEWLNARGITAFVLTYRLPGEGWKAGPLSPLQDAQRALRLIRAKANEFKIDKNNIGVLGFSAGGHLMGLASVRSDFQSYNPVDEADKQSARPDWAALVYPVISLSDPFNRTSTRRQMVGLEATAQAVAEWSVNTHVNKSTPPMLLVHATDDPIADFHHSEIMKAACEGSKVPVELVRLPAGGHGFGMSRPGASSYGWSAHLDDWLKRGPLKLKQAEPQIASASTKRS